MTDAEFLAMAFVLALAFVIAMIALKILDGIIEHIKNLQYKIMTIEQRIKYLEESEPEDE